MMHAPIALLPTPFPEIYWKQACDVAPIFNELIDRVSLDSQFLQDSLSRFVFLKSLSFLFIPNYLGIGSYLLCIISSDNYHCRMIGFTMF